MVQFFVHHSAFVKSPMNLFHLLWITLVACYVQPLDASQAPDQLPSAESIQAQIEQIKNDARLEDSETKRQITQLQLALKRRNEAIELTQQALSYAQSMSKAAEQEKKFKAKLATVKETPLSRTVRRASLTKLESLVAQYDSELATMRKQLTQVSNDIKNEKAFDIQVALDKARQAIQLQSVEPVNNQSGEFNQTLLDVTLLLQQAQIENLEQRLLSRNTRLSLWEAHQKLLVKQTNYLESKLGQIRALVTNHRQNDVNQIMSNVKAYSDTVTDQPKLVIDLANRNVALAEELNQLVGEQDLVISQKENVTLGAQKTQLKYTSLTEQLSISQLGSSPQFGAALRKQRDQITEENRARHALSQQQQKLTKSRLSQFRIDALRERDIDSELEQISLELARATLAPATEKQLLILRDLLKTRNTILEKLSTAYWNYISNLTSLTIQSASLIDLNKQYANLLDQQLLWMPSSPLMGLNTISSMSDSILFFNKLKLWRESAKSISLKVKNYTLFMGFSVIVFLLLLLKHGRLVEILSNMKDRVGKVNKDSMSLTLVGLVITLMLAMKGPWLIFSSAILVLYHR
jgi:hypothetical protein